MMENWRLRNRLATTGTFFTFSGLAIIFLKRIFEGVTQTALTPWGLYLGIICLVVAAIAFSTVVYLDETNHYMNDHPRLSR